MEFNRKKYLLLVLFALLFIYHCDDQNNKTFHLSNGLLSFERQRPVNESLNDEVTIESFAIFKEKKKGSVSMVLKLKPLKDSTLIQNYSLAIHAFVNKDHLKGDRPYLLLDYKPEIVNVNDFQYLIKTFETGATRIDSVDLFLYHRDKYRQILGKKITIRNIGI